MDITVIKDLAPLLFVLLCVVLIICALINEQIKVNNILEEIKKAREIECEKIRELASGSQEISAKEIMNINADDNDFEGVYIIYNNIKEMYYVGQSKNAIGRVKTHFSGRGNGDVYADYKYGDDFTIKFIALENSGFSSLNSLERNTIDVYDAFSKGYNKTRGNSG